MGVSSFVTLLSGLNSECVNTATMMVTSIYDQFAGQAINVNGNVLVTFIDNDSATPQQCRLERIKRSFSVKVIVAESTETGQLAGDVKSNSVVKGIFGVVLGAANAIAPFFIRVAE